MIFAKGRKAEASVKTIKVSKSDQGRFSLTDKEIINLSKSAMIIEKHYKKTNGY